MKKITIYDIAKTAGVSAATVSRVLNHPEQVQFETRQKIYQIMEQKNFTKRAYTNDDPAVPNIKHKSFLVNLPSLSTSFYRDVIDGATSAAYNHGDVIFIDTFPLTELNIDTYFFILEAHHISGLILMNAVPAAVLTKLKKHLPVIQCAECNASDRDLSFVGIDDGAACRMIVTHLISAGCRQIAYMTIDLRFPSARSRLQIFRTAFEHAGISLQEDRILTMPKFDFSMAYHAAIQLLSSKDRPDTILAASDIFASACLKAADTLDISIPDELSLISLEDTAMLESSFPPITALQQPGFTIGSTALEVLAAEIQHPQSRKQQIRLPAQFIVRGSLKGAGSLTT